MIDLTKEVKSCIEANNLFKEKHRLLVALSGGVDSMVLLNILIQLGFNIAAAHANYMLRGDESLRDELFVKKTCKKLNIPLHVKQFEVIQSSKKNKTSIQEEARNKRYKWFEKLLKQYQYDFICTAHHADDLAETMLINLVRGTGLEGLTGIKLLQNNIVRPILYITKKQILEFAQVNQIDYVDDSSNQSLKYTRNKIRLKAIPILQQINPDFIHTATRNSKILSAQLYYYKSYISSVINDIVQLKNNIIEINSQKLHAQKYPAELLFEIIGKYHFNYVQCNEIIASSSKQNTGAMFHSSTHQLLINRNKILLEPKTSNDAQVSYVINEVTNKLKTKYYSFEISYKSKSRLKIFNKNTLYFDKDLLNFPLTITPVFEGARFSPLGLKGSKKVSDYLIDKKVSLFDKEKVFLLMSKGKIAALIPFQTDNAFKITDKTKTVMILKIKEGV